MKIALTGSSGRLGGQLIKALNQEHDVVSLGRRNCPVPWSLGLVPSPESLQDVGAIIHCAWSTKDRKRDFHLNVGGTLALARYAEAASMPFLFVSSVAALSQSFYGIAKLEAESLVERHQGSILRIGLVPQSNLYFEKKKKLLGLAPSFPGYLNLTEFQTLSKWICAWIEKIQSGDTLPVFETAVSSNILASELFSAQSRYSIPIPISILRNGLQASGRINRRSANLLDALNSLITTPKMLP